MVDRDRLERELRKAHKKTNKGLIRNWEQAGARFERNSTNRPLKSELPYRGLDEGTRDSGQSNNQTFDGRCLPQTLTLDKYESLTHIHETQTKYADLKLSVKDPKGSQFRQRRIDLDSRSEIVIKKWLRGDKLSKEDLVVANEIGYEINLKENATRSVMGSKNNKVWTDKVDAVLNTEIVELIGCDGSVIRTTRMLKGSSWSLTNERIPFNNKSKIVSLVASLRVTDSSGIQTIEQRLNSDHMVEMLSSIVDQNEKLVDKSKAIKIDNATAMALLERNAMRGNLTSPHKLKVSYRS